MKRLTTILALIFFSMGLIGLACNPQASPAAKPGEEQIKATPAAPTAAWETRWNDTIKAARQEGKVVFINRLAPGLRTPLSRDFKEKYGVDIEFMVGTVSELLPKITAQQNAGLFLPDVFQEGATSLVDLKKANILAPLEPELILPEIKDPQAWTDKRLPFQDKEGFIFMFLYRVGATILANSELVKPDEIKSWRNLLEPKWKGRILLFDPTISGPGNGLANSVSQLMGMDYLRELAKQEPMVNRDLRLQVEWVARGKYPLALGFEFMMMEEMRGAGAPIYHIVPAEGTRAGAQTGSIGMISRPANPNAARLFLNWFLSRETQTLFAKEAKEQSRRADVPSVLHPDRQFNPSMKYIDFDTDDFLSRNLQMREEAKQIFAQGLK